VAEPAAAPLPEDCAALVAELERLEREALALAGPLDDAAFNWQPDGGKGWSVGQCLEHLERTNRLYLDALEDALRKAREQGLERKGPLDPGRIGRWFIAQIEPPVRRKTAARKKTQPASRCIKAATLAAFSGEQQRAIDLVRAAAPYDCNSVRYRNPLAAGLRAFNLATGMMVINAHERRHLAQASRVVASPAFPRDTDRP
jgi:hypothetical protein